MMATRSRLFDMHAHLDFAPHPAALAADLDARDVSVFSATVTPTGYEHAVRELASCGNVRVAAGLHPWWVRPDGATDAAVEQVESLVEAVRFIGEVGLDFADSHVATRDAQLAAFERIMGACAQRGNKVISLHAVRSADVVLDVLEQRRAARENACIFHWFSGTSNDLQRAVALGCFFSIGPRMLATKRGRAYAQAVPRNRLLLETDEPPQSGETGEAAVWRALLEDALVDLARLRGESLDELADSIDTTSRALFAGSPGMQG